MYIYICIAIKVSFLMDRNGVVALAILNIGIRSVKRAFCLLTRHSSCYKGVLSVKKILLMGFRLCKVYEYKRSSAP